MNHPRYLEVSHVSVALLTPCVVTQLHIPLTRQTMEKIRKLFQDGVEDVLKEGEANDDITGCIIDVWGGS